MTDGKPTLQVPKVPARWKLPLLGLLGTVTLAFTVSGSLGLTLAWATLYVAAWVARATGKRIKAGSP